jgi:hypothetical protein
MPQILANEKIMESHGGPSTPINATVFGSPIRNQGNQTLITNAPNDTDYAEEEMIRFQMRDDPRIQRLVAATLPSCPSIPDFSRIRLSLTPSQVLAPAYPSETPNRSSTISKNPDSGLSMKNLASIPSAVVHTLVRAFIEQIHNLHPFLYSPSLVSQVDRVLCIVHADQPLQIRPDFDFLVVYIVLAISVSLGSAVSGHGPRRMLFSEALFREGIQHYCPPEIFQTELAELQITLLFLQYGTINPRCASVWMLGGAAMRQCLKLGLHRELPACSILNPVRTDLRRRVFWMAYCLDRHISSALQYPISLSDTAINARQFSVQDDVSITEHGIVLGTGRSKEPAFHWLEYRQIHSEMVEVHFHNKPLAQGYGWEDWVAETEVKLRKWYERHNEEYEWTHTAYNNALTYLHRPSPRTPLPSSRSLLIAFENACKVGLSYNSDIRAGYFRRTWLAAHHTFGSAVIVLFCLRHGSDRIMGKFSAEEIYEMTKVFTKNLQSISSESWPEVSKYADLYERLLTPLIEAIFSDIESRVVYDAEQDAELARLLYPGMTQFDFGRPGTTVQPEQLIQGDVDMQDWDLAPFDDVNFENIGFEFWQSELENV